MGFLLTLDFTVMDCSKTEHLGTKNQNLAGYITQSKDHELRKRKDTFHMPVFCLCYILTGNEACLSSIKIFQV